MLSPMVSDRWIAESHRPHWPGSLLGSSLATPRVAPQNHGHLGPVDDCPKTCVYQVYHLSWMSHCHVWLLEGHRTINIIKPHWPIEGLYWFVSKQVMNTIKVWSAVQFPAELEYMCSTIIGPKMVVDPTMSRQNYPQDCHYLRVPNPHLYPKSRSCMCVCVYVRICVYVCVSLKMQLPRFTYFLFCFNAIVQMHLSLCMYNCKKIFVELYVYRILYHHIDI